MNETNNQPQADLLRVVYTILYLVIERVLSTVLIIVVVMQFISSWVSGNPHEKLLSFTNALSKYVKELIAYVGFNTDTKPWPMGDWPSK